jgi:dienelactone hydrolase
MFRETARTLRYVRSWRGGGTVVEREVEILRDGSPVSATLFLPATPRHGLPGWIALGGVSRMGRFHPQLVRFARALAATGAGVLVPDVPEWRRLRVSPRATAPTLRGCIEAMANQPEIDTGKYGLIGFSFGAPQVAVAAARDELADHVAGIVLFGGYCSLLRTLTYQLTGCHEWEGCDYTGSPDPYGRYIVASNYLTDVPGYEDAGDVAEALHRLAEAASDHRIKAWEPFHDEMILELRASLPARRRDLFDDFARTSASTRGTRPEAGDLAEKLAEACGRVDPLLEPLGDLGRVDLPTQLIHGRGDRLIPFTEGLRLMDGLPAHARRGATVTRLFDHSSDTAPTSLATRVVETAAFLRALNRLIATV